jgi:plastocyanin
MVHSKEKIITLNLIQKYSLFSIIVLFFMIASGCNSESVDNSNKNNGSNIQSEIKTDTLENIDNNLPNLPRNNPNEPVVATISPEPVQELIPQSPVEEKKFVLSGGNFKFYQGQEVNPTLIVSEGDSVVIEFSSDFGYHDWVVDELGAATQRVRPDDGISVVKFTADKKGTFEYYCSVGSHRQQGMKGKIIVE